MPGIYGVEDVREILIDCMTFRENFSEQHFQESIEKVDERKRREHQQFQQPMRNSLESYYSGGMGFVGPSELRITPTTPMMKGMIDPIVDLKSCIRKTDMFRRDLGSTKLPHGGEFDW